MAQSHHMPMRWHKRATDESVPATQAPIDDKAALVCRIGALLLSAGTGAWRVRDSMNRISQALGVTCSADLGLVSIECTCAEGVESATEVHSLPSSGVNTERIMLMDDAVDRIEAQASEMTLGQVHGLLDSIQATPGRYAPSLAGLASAAACAAFVFLLGGGPIEMSCAFVGAGLGNWLRRAMLDRHLNQFLSICCSVALACMSYLLSLTLLSQVIPGAMDHEAGYIGAMLFVIPGFPLITSGLDLMKLDMRSGIERLVYALAVIFVATFVAMLVAMGVNLAPDDFVPLGLSEPVMVLLRLAMSFVGVFGFSVMFNSPLPTCATAGVAGAVANTLRLELVAVAGMEPAAAALVGALVAGLIASRLGLLRHYPRISLTVPSIVIMVPGLYMYRAVYYMGAGDAVSATGWLIKAALIVAALPLGLALARVLTDERWRTCS